MARLVIPPQHQGLLIITDQYEVYNTHGAAGSCIRQKDTKYGHSPPKESSSPNGLDAHFAAGGYARLFSGIKKQVANKLGLSIFSIQLLETHGFSRIAPRLSADQTVGLSLRPFKIRLQENSHGYERRPGLVSSSVSPKTCSADKGAWCLHGIHSRAEADGTRLCLLGKKRLTHQS